MDGDSSKAVVLVKGVIGYGSNLHPRFTNDQQATLSVSKNLLGTEAWGKAVTGEGTYTLLVSNTGKGGITLGEGDLAWNIQAIE